MKEDLIEKIEIPEGFEWEVEGNFVKLKFGNKENKRRFNFYGVELRKEGNSIIIEAKNATKKELQVVYTARAHINNMIEGLRKPFEYKLEIAFVHFPMTVEYKQAENKILIKNFLGEKKNREADILPGVEIEVGKKEIILKSCDIELAGQTAANIEKATQIKNKDRRKFQDGIFLTKKPRRVI